MSHLLKTNFGYSFMYEGSSKPKPKKFDFENKIKKHVPGKLQNRSNGHARDQSFNSTIKYNYKNRKADDTINSFNKMNRENRMVNKLTDHALKYSANFGKNQMTHRSTKRKSRKNTKQLNKFSNSNLMPSPGGHSHNKSLVIGPTGSSDKNGHPMAIYLNEIVSQKQHDVINNIIVVSSNDSGKIKNTMESSNSSYVSSNKGEGP